MTRIAVDLLLALLHESFDGEGAHSLLANVRDLRAEEWDWLLDGGERTARQIVEHVAIAKHLHVEHLFGAAKRSYRDVLGESPLRTRPGDTDALIEWARDGHVAFAAGVAALHDADLETPTRRHYRKVQSTGSVIGVIVQHDCYHAGEINHLRALRHGDDGWWPGLTEDQP